jgi:hypothetical protein
MITIINELAQGLSTKGSRVETKREERRKGCSFGSLEGIDVTTDIPLAARDGEDTRNIGLPLHRT